MRNYDASSRASAARVTRARVLEAAQALFLDRGYHATTVSQLAAAAGVSPQTIYNSIGPKAAVLKAVYDVLLAGDDEPIAINDRPEIARVRAQRGPEATLRSYAALARRFVERSGPLIGMVLSEGPGADEYLRGLLDTIERERRLGNAGVVRHMVAKFSLSDRLDPDQLIDHVWTLTSVENSDRLIRRCGWSLDAYEEWLASTLVAGFVALAGPSPSTRP